MKTIPPGLAHNSVPASRGTFVNVYDMGRSYGGAEEGGWYYDTWTLIASHRIRGSINSHRAIRQLNTLRAQYGFTSSRSPAFQARWRDRKNGHVSGYGRRTEHADRCYSEIGGIDKTLITLESARGFNGDNYSPYC